MVTYTSLTKTEKTLNELNKVYKLSKLNLNLQKFLLSFEYDYKGYFEHGQWNSVNLASDKVTVFLLARTLSLRCVPRLTSYFSLTSKSVS